MVRPPLEVAAVENSDCVPPGPLNQTMSFIEPSFPKGSFLAPPQDLPETAWKFSELNSLNPCPLAEIRSSDLVVAASFIHTGNTGSCCTGKPTYIVNPMKCSVFFVVSQVGNRGGQWWLHCQTCLPSGWALWQ